MAGGIRFVMEGPNADLSQKKKRARLITACDACRTKKIKCVQPDVNVECEACRRSQTACLFGDRDRYHTERGISTALPHAHGLGGLRHPGYRYIPNEQRERAYSIDSWSLSAPAQPIQSLSTNTNVGTSTTLLRHSAHLFHPTEIQRPRPDLLTHLLTIFISKLWANHSFLSLEQLRQALIDPAALHPVLANGIAALASRFSTNVEFTQSGVRNQLYGEPYLHMVKLLLTYGGSGASTSNSTSAPTPLERLHALILVAWSEYGNTSSTNSLMPESGGMAVYAKQAIQLALELGLDQPNQMTGATEKLTWFHVRKLDLVCSWTISTPTTISATTPINSRELTPLGLEDISSLNAQDAISPTLAFACLNEVFSIHDSVSSLMKSTSSFASSPAETILALQARLDNFVKQLSSVPDLTFTRENFAMWTEKGWSTIFVMMHLLYHSTNCMVNWSTLFRSFDELPFGMGTRTNVEAAYASALAIVDVLFTAKSIDPLSVIVDPLLEVPLAVATRILISAPNSPALSLMNKAPEAVQQDSKLGWETCMRVLSDLTVYWSSTHVVNSASSPSTSASSSSPLTPPASATVPMYEIAVPAHTSLSSSPTNWTLSSVPSPSTPSISSSPYFDPTTSALSTPAFGATFDIPLGLATFPTSAAASVISSASSTPPPGTPPMAHMFPESPSPFDMTFSSSTMGMNLQMQPQMNLSSSNMASFFDLNTSSTASGSQSQWDLSFLTPEVELDKGSGEFDMLFSNSTKANNFSSPEATFSFDSMGAFFLPSHTQTHTQTHTHGQQAC